MTSTDIETATITSGQLTAQILNVGAALMDLSISMRDGPRSVILSLGNQQSYLNNPHYLGVIAGRCANRIKGGDCWIDGHSYQLDRNEDGQNHLHGGKGGFSHRPWRIAQKSASSVELRLHSLDGDQGYPGNMDVICLYEALPDARLRISIQATCDATTLANMATHAYFNLTPGSSILDHKLQIHARTYLPVDRALIPDGRISNVAGTCFDFLLPKRIEARREETDFGYDHNFVLGPEPQKEPRLAAVLTSPNGDLSLEIHSTEPGLQFYDGHKLSSNPSESTTQLHPFDGCCLEPQRFPDAIHHPHFATAILRVGEIYRQVTEYRFFTSADDR